MKLSNAGSIIKSRAKIKFTNIFLNAYRSASLKRPISRLYHSLITLKMDTTVSIKEKWEKEMDFIISEEMWTKI